MSQYTTELRYLIQQKYDFGLKDYPLFDESYRPVLNKKIMDEYFFREIGQETPERFKHHLNHTMNMIMPYYNQLYHSQLLEIDPLLSFRETEELKQTTEVETDTASTRKLDQDQTTNGKVNSTNIATGGATVSTLGTETTDEDTTNTKTENGMDVKSDTPGGMIAVADLKTHTWASNADIREGTVGDVGSSDRTVTKDEDVTSTTNQTATGSGTTNQMGNLNEVETDTRAGNVNTTDEYLKTKFGFSGNQSRLLIEYRKTFLNIDQMIVRDLNVLFMGIY